MSHCRVAPAVQGCIDLSGMHFAGFFTGTNATNVPKQLLIGIEALYTLAERTFTDTEAQSYIDDIKGQSV